MENSARFYFTHRDLDILLMVHAYNGCTSEHIRARFFPSPGARSACYARLSRLKEVGYLAGTRLASLSGVGSGKSLLTVGPKARPALAEALGLSLSDVQRASRAISPIVIAHHLGVCDFRLAVELATAGSPSVSLTQWLTDQDLHRNPMMVTDPLNGQELPIIPDSSFTLELSDGSSQQFFVELDRGTVSATKMNAKLYAYLVDAAQRAERVPFLIVASTKARQEAIAHWALERAVGSSRVDLQACKLEYSIVSPK